MDVKTVSILERSELGPAQISKLKRPELKGKGRFNRSSRGTSVGPKLSSETQLETPLKNLAVNVSQNDTNEFRA